MRRREIEQAVEGYEAREAWASAALGAIGVFASLSQWLWRTASAVLRSLRLRWSIRVTKGVYVSGPMRLGDEHPTRKGWFYTGKRDRNGVLLWYKPPGPVSRWVRRIGIIGYLTLMAFGVGIAFLMGK